MTKALKHILLYEILQGKIINSVVFPFAYMMRDEVEEQAKKEETV